MKDRILVRQGKKQLYGTQSRMVDGKLALYPVEVPENLKKTQKKSRVGEAKDLVGLFYSIKISHLLFHRAEFPFQ